MLNENALKDVIENPPNRRKFFQNLGVAGAVMGLAAMPKTLQAQAATAITDVDILNFALNLEYLEAEFYNIATSGMSLDQLGVNIDGPSNLGVSTGGYPVAFTDPIVQAVAKELASDELSHVVLLQGAIAGLGGTPIARPPINLAALGFGFASQSEFLTLARIFEDIGVTAYGGAAPLIQSSAILGYAARILAVEAVHSGNIRLMMAQKGITTPAVDGADVIPPPSGMKYFPTNNSALTEVRTPGEVLVLAYGGVSLAKGGFFPSGVNGNLNMSAAAAAMLDGAMLTASPNPITGSGGLGQTTITWNAPGAKLIEVHVNSPSGPLFTQNVPSGSMQTEQWVTNGMTFFLQDASPGAVSSSVAATLATVTVVVS